MITNPGRVILFVCGLLICQLAIAAPGRVPGDTNALEAYANRPNSLEFEITDPESWSGGLVRWQLSYESRILKQGTVKVFPEDEIITLEITFPPVKDDNIVKTELRLELLQNGDDRAVVTNKTIHVFGDDPFRRIREQSGSIDTLVFDPHSTLVELFERIDIPMVRLNRLSEAKINRYRLLVVGENLSLKQHQIQQLLEFARHGMIVLMINPKALEIPLDIDADLAAKPLSMRLYDQVSLAAKPLNVATTNPQQAPFQSSLHLTKNRSGVSVEVINDKFGWRWFELNYEGRGKFLVSSYSLLQEVKQSPSLLYFLKELIEAQ